MPLSPTTLRLAFAGFGWLALLAPGMAQADQFKQAADGAAIDCTVSQRELTRFALVEDQFASVSKMSSGFPYNDFAVSNEPLRGDIYVSVPETFAARSISFFATTKKGQVYKFACRIEAIEAQQVFITNPALAENEAARFENAGEPDQVAIALIRAMASDGLIEGYEIRHPAGFPSRIGEVQLIADYRGAALVGKAIRVANRSNDKLTLSEHEFSPAGSVALAIARPDLAPGEVTTAYLVMGAGASGHD